MPRKSTNTEKSPVRKKAASSANVPKRHKKAASAPLTPREVTQEEIARLAYAYWEQRGYENGSPEVDWFRAERELRATERQPK